MAQLKLTAFYSKPSALSSNNEETTSTTKEPSVKDQPSATEKVEGENSSKKRVTNTSVKRFQTSWLSEFSWLRYDTNHGTMHCITCEKFDKAAERSVFVKGCTNYQRSALTRHQTESNTHLAATQAKKQCAYMEAARNIVNEKLEPILEAQLRTALFMAKENTANRKFLNLIDLQIANAHIFAGTSSSTSGSAHQKFKGIYTNNQAASVMQGYLAEVLMEMAVVRIKSSPYIGVMVDESLDIATTKKLVTFCKIIHNNELKIEFCANIEVINGTAETIYTAITDWLASVGVNINKVSGFGSDGAAVMTGKRSGVGVRLQQINPRIIHIWCAAHRVALVSYWAAKKVPYLQKVQEILVNIYNFYEYSAPRYNKIRELKNVLGEQVIKFKKPTHVRWLSLQHAIDAVHSSWSALVLGLEHEVANDPSSVGGNKAKGILKEIKCFKFIATICLLRDVLETLGKLSKCFQKDIVDIHQVNCMITATKETISVLDEVDAEPATVQVLLDDIDGSGEYHGIGLECSYRDRLEHFRLRSNFSRNIIEQFDQRFPEHDMKILKDLNTILNPALLPQSRQSIVDHGHDALRHITDVYGENTINSEQTRNAFLQFKFLLNVNRHLNLQNMCMKILSEYSETFPNFASLAAILSTVPLTSVPCERGFSLQNRHVNRYTSRRSVKNCENRMLIAWAANQPDFDENETIRRASIKMNRQ